MAGNLYVFKRGAEHELSGVEDKRRILSRFDHLSEIGHVFPNIDVGAARVLEHQNLWTEMDVDAGGLNTAVAQRIDDDAAFVDLFSYRSVAQYHAVSPTPCRYGGEGICLRGDCSNQPVAGATKRRTALRSQSFKSTPDVSSTERSTHASLEYDPDGEKQELDVHARIQCLDI